MLLPYRINAAPEPEPAEIEEPYARVLRAQQRRARVVTAAIVIVAAGAPLAKLARAGTPAPETAIADGASAASTRIDGARSAIAVARSRAALAQSRFEATVRDAIAGDVGARPDLGACPVALPAPARLTTGRPAFPLLVVDRTELDDGLPSQTVAGVLADVHRAERLLARGHFEEAELYARALARPDRFAYDVVLVAHTTKHPRATSGAAYEPGEIDGRAYVYDFASGRVVCSGDVEARSSKHVGYVFSDRADSPLSLGAVRSMGDAIQDDIRLQTERAIIEGVRWRADAQSSPRHSGL